MLRKRIKSFGITNTRYLEPALIKLKYKFLGNFLARFGAFGAVWSASSDEKNKKMPKKISKNCIYNFGKNKFSNKTKNKKVFLVNKENIKKAFSVFLAFQILVTYSLVSATAKNHHKNENIPLQSVSMASEGGSEKITDEKIFHNNCDKHSANDDSKNVKDQSKKFKNIAKYSCLGILAFFTIYFVNEKNKKNEKHYHEHDILEKSQQWFANFKKKNLK